MARDDQNLPISRIGLQQGSAIVQIENVKPLRAVRKNGRDRGRLTTMFEPRERVFMPGSSREPTAILCKLFVSYADILTSFVPGVNSVPADGRAYVAGLFGQNGTTALPISYGAFARDLGVRFPIDTAIVQVSPPDAMGRVSFGPAVEFGPRALAAARR